MRFIHFSIAAVLFALVPVSGSAAEPVTDPSTAVLKEFGIGADQASLGRYLRGLNPDSESRKRLQQLVLRLGDGNFHAREAAMQQLMRTPTFSKALLLHAIESDDPEICWRARHVLKRGDQRGEQILVAVLSVIRLRKYKGLAQPILEAMPFCTDSYQQRLARDALLATIQPVDAPLLRQELRRDDLHRKTAAIQALGHVLGNRAGEEIRKLLKDPDDRVRLTAARTLANQGDRTSLPTLVGLLRSDEVLIRVGGIQVLRAATSQQFGFLAYEDRESRTTALRRWQTWVEKNQKTAAITFPLKDVAVELGRTLICLATQQKVIELDAQGRQVWEQGGLSYPWRASGLANGHRLVASHTSKFVVEYDTNGKEVWRKSNLPGGPHSVERLSNGNTLMACSDSNFVVEVRPDGSTAWQINIAGRPTDARRLPNGLTLVTLKNAGQVVEVNRSGKVRWKIEGLKWPNTAQRLENGNTLIAEVKSKRVVEFDRKGKLVWEKNSLTNPYDAQRLSNGQTLIVERSGIRIVDAAGKIVWQKQYSGDVRAVRY